MFWRKFEQTEGTRWATGAADINLVILINAELQVSRQSATAKVEPLIKVSRFKDGHQKQKDSNYYSIKKKKARNLLHDN